MQKALAQKGDRYVFGAETNLNDPNPSKFDCSELVQWAAHQAGVSVPDGTMNQVPYFKQKGTTISVAEALRTRGALLYRPGHVAISLGDGRTIEARGSAYGVNIFSANGRGWTSGALIPGLKYG
ncbi:C40 family peptidase [Myxococcus sp. QH3KD-4-1]|nr:C40 family peptidase [Myxococcus qinghaiensis]